jgi:hypothetical protein
MTWSHQYIRKKQRSPDHFMEYDAIQTFKVIKPCFFRDFDSASSRRLAVGCGFGVRRFSDVGSTEAKQWCGMKKQRAGPGDLNH